MSERCYGAIREERFVALEQAYAQTHNAGMEEGKDYEREESMSC